MTPISPQQAEARRVEHAALASREAGLGAEGCVIVETAAPTEADGTHHLWAMAADLCGRGRPDTANEILEASEAEGPRWGKFADKARDPLARAPAARRTREAQTRTTAAIRRAVRSTGYDPWS